MKRFAIFLIALALEFMPLAGFAQSGAGLQYGQTPTVGQWNSYFAAKLDYNPAGLPIMYGGTGATTASAGFSNLVGSQPTSGYFVRGNGTAWAASTIQASDVPTLNQNTTGTAGALAGGALGSLPYQAGAGTTAFLAGNSTTTPKFLTSTGTGSAAQSPTLTSSTGSGSVVLSTGATLNAATLVTSTINGNTITTGTGTLTLGAKTLTASNSLTLAGTDGTTMTFPSTSATIARTDASQSFTGTQNFSGPTVLTGAVSGAGAVAFQAAPNPIGSTTPNSGAFTSLSASGAVSGTGFSSYLASPPAIGGTTPAAITGTTVTATGSVSIGSLTFSATAPTLGTCGSSSTIVANGTAAFRITLHGSTSSCAINLPAASTGWNCFAQNVTTIANAWIIRQSATSTTSVTLTNYSGTSLQNWTDTDVLAASCFAY